MSNVYIKYIIVALIGIAIVFGYFLIYGLFDLTELDEILKCVCDGLTIAGIAISGSGLLLLVSNLGAFDGLTYSVTSIFSMRWPGKYNLSEHETYQEYTERKRKKKVRTDYLIITGVSFLLLALITLIWYLNVTI